MKLNIDTDSQRVVVENEFGTQELDLYSKPAFELISDIWLKTSWNQKYSYTYTWMGRPIIQHPEDIARVQEVVYALKPDVVIETGVAHGGSLIFFASIMKVIGRGHVVGIDIEIRPHNRAAIESHELASMITLIEGDSTAPEIVAEAAAIIKPGDKVLVVLDSNHTKAHVARELEAYCDLVTKGSYIVATDGLMESLHDVPRGDATWAGDNPSAAAREFAASRADFVLEEPQWLFNESELNKSITGWPDAWLRRKK